MISSILYSIGIMKVVIFFSSNDISLTFPLYSLTVLVFGMTPKFFQRVLWKIFILLVIDCLPAEIGFLFFKSNFPLPYDAKFWQSAIIFLVNYIESAV